MGLCRQGGAYLVSKLAERIRWNAPDALIYDWKGSYMGFVQVLIHPITAESELAVIGTGFVMWFNFGAKA